MSIQKERVIELDVLRFLAIIFVLYGHSVGYQIVNNYENFNYDIVMINAGISDTNTHLFLLTLGQIIYLFHMPLFFAISGALFSINITKYLNLSSLIKDKTKKLLVPFLLTNVFWNIPLKTISGFYNNAWGGQPISKNSCK